MLLIEFLFMHLIGDLHALARIEVLDDEAEILCLVFLLVDHFLPLVAIKDFVVLGVLGRCFEGTHGGSFVFGAGVAIVLRGLHHTQD